MTVCERRNDPPADARPSAGRHWVPIRALAPRHRPRIGAHLLALPEHDRYRRFGHAASDAHIARYVDLLDFGRDEILGIFTHRLELAALMHLAFTGAAGAPPEAELGLSVLPGCRGRGFGHRLFERAVLQARNRDTAFLRVHALSDNTPMLHIAKTAGARVERRGPESEAVLALPPHTLGTQVTALLEQQAAELDYGWKRQARRVDRLIDQLAAATDGDRTG